MQATLEESKEFLEKSLCAIEDQEKEYLKTILGFKEPITTMLYRGSQDGWAGKDMHSKCDGKKATVSLLKMQNGGCIGGFTKS